MQTSIANQFANTAYKWIEPVVPLGASLITQKVVCIATCNNRLINNNRITKGSFTTAHAITGMYALHQYATMIYNSPQLQHFIIDRLHNLQNITHTFWQVGSFIINTATDLSTPILKPFYQQYTDATISTKLIATLTPFTLTGLASYLINKTPYSENMSPMLKNINRLVAFSTPVIANYLEIKEDIMAYVGIENNVAEATQAMASWKTMSSAYQPDPSYIHTEQQNTLTSSPITKRRHFLADDKTQ